MTTRGGAISIGVTRDEIVTRIATEERVEKMVRNICKHHRNADLADLAQMVYLALLTTDEERMQDLWENGEMNFYISRIILNQYRSVTSPYHRLFRKQQARQLSINEEITIDEIDQMKNR